MTEPSPIAALRTRHAVLVRDLEHLAAHVTDLDRAVERAEDAFARRSDDRSAAQAHDHARAKRDQARAILRARKRELEAVEAKLADPALEARARRYDAACAQLAAGADEHVLEILSAVEELGSQFAAARAELRKRHEARVLAYGEACELSTELGAKRPPEPVCDAKLVLRSALARGLRAGGANPLDRDVSDSLAVHQADAPSVPYI